MKKLLSLLTLIPLIAACTMGATSLNKPTTGGNTGGDSGGNTGDYTGTSALPENTAVTYLNSSAQENDFIADMENIQFNLLSEDFNGNGLFRFVLNSDNVITGTDIQLSAHNIGTRIDDTADFNFTDPTDFSAVRYRYQSFGKDFGMVYSDVGKLLNVDENGNEIGEPKYFIGGYKIKNVAERYMGDKYVFSGTAKGAVKSSQTGEILELTDNNATLTFDRNQSYEITGTQGVQTLKANFSNWYKITVDKYGIIKPDGSIPGTFVLIDLDDTGKSINSAYQITSDNQGKMMTGYYEKENPAENMPEEAVAIFIHQYDDGSKQVDTEIFFGGQAE